MAITTISVSTAEELFVALNNATGGETIELAPGDYGHLEFITWKTFGIKSLFDSEVTIRSADPNAPASFSGIDLRAVQNLTFDSVVFDFDMADAPVWASPFMIADSTGITIKNSLFEGTIASGTGDPTTDGFATGKGLTVGNSSNIVIENNEFTTWHRALVVGGSTDVTIRGNEIHSIRSDGMDFAQVNSVLIEDNYIHDFVASEGSADHRDMIQFWTTGTTAPSTDITIRGNTLDIGLGNQTQSIFMRNELVDLGQAGPEMFYRNILIEQNVILNGHSHGITVGETDGLVIRKNTVLSVDRNDDDFAMTPRINVSSASVDVVIEQNAVAAISGYSGQESWRVGSNAIIQNEDVTLDSHFEDQFVTSSMRTGSVNDFRTIPGSLVANLGAGADRLSASYASGEVTPLFDVKTSPESVNTLVFDASFSVDGGGNALPEGTTFAWQFGDGSTASGVRVQHSFAEPGYHDARLTVTLPDGSTHQARATIGLAGEQVLSFNAQDGRFYTHGFGEEAALAGSDAGSVDTAGGKAIDLGAPGTVAAVAKEEIRRFFGADEFEINMTLKADVPLQSFGEIARIHTGMMISVEQNGALNFGMATDEGWFTVKTAGVRINDGAEHDISIRYDNDTDRLEILVDGNLMGTAAASGSLAEMKHWGLTFGNPWGSDNFDGKLSAFSIDAPSNDFPVYEETDATVGTSVPGPDQDVVPPVEVPAGTEEPQDETAAPPAGESPPAEEEARQEQGVLPEGEAGIDAPADSVIGEIHKVTLTHAESILRLDNTYENPVVIAQSMTANGGQPFAVRLSQVSSNEIRLSLQEPNYLDGLHVPEDVVVMVLEAGVHILPDGTRIEAGTLTSDKLSSAGFESVAFEHGFDTTPAILSQVQTRNGEDYVVTRQRDADGSGFQLTMQEEEARNGGRHLPETIGWVAIESGAGNWSGIAFEAGSTGDRVQQKGAKQEFAGDFDEAPLVLSGISSFRGPDTAWSAVRNVSATGFTTWVQEEQSRDKEMRHLPESVDFIAFANTGTLRGTTVETQETTLALFSSDSESGTGAFPALDDYVLDVAALGTEDSAVVLVDDAHVVAGSEGTALRFDGDRDFVALGRLQQFETADQLSYSVTFQRDDPDADAQRLVWNHLKTGLTIEGDSLRIHVASAERSFTDGFVIRDAGLLDSERHEARVIIDSVADRLQVVLDGEIVLDERGVDLDLTADAGRQWGWSLGTAWDRFYEGEVSDFRIEAAADFIEDRPLHEQDGLLLSA